MNKKIFVPLIALLLVLTSCKTKEKVSQLNYLQNVENIATEVSQKTSRSTIQAGDQLSIIVTAKNMDVVKPFNQGYYSSQNSIGPGGSTQNSNLEKSYLVNSEGNIDFPILGSVNTTQKTLEELKIELTERVSTYVKNPTINVKFLNFKVTILGEVARPGVYTITDVNSSILNAIGLAGDLTMYGKRDDILIVRNVNGQTTKDRLNLMDGNLITSPYYQLKQGDVIYVSATPTKDKTARLDPNTNVYIAVAGTIIGLAGIFITIFKK